VQGSGGHSFNQGASVFMRINSSGNVGIGTTSPTDTLSYGRALDIQSSTGAAVYLRDLTDTAKYGLIAYDGESVNRTSIGAIGTDNYLRFVTVSTERMVITSEGYVGISTGNTNIVSGDLIGVLAFNSKDASTNSSGAIGSIRSYATADFNTGNVSGDLRFYTQDTGTPNGSLLSGAERLRIKAGGQITTHDYAYGGNLGFEFNSSGYAQIGINTNTVGSEVILVNNLTSGGSASVLQYRTTGTIEGSLEGTSSGLAISNVSDYRKKTDIRNLSNSLAVIGNLQPRLYKYKEGLGKPTDKDFVGFIAHEVQEVLPDSVTGNKDAVYTQEDIDNGAVGFSVGDPKYQTVSYTSNELITYLVGAIQELKAENDALKSRLEALEQA
jgi:hypothetical protein